MQLALPAGGRPTPRNVLTSGALALAAGATALMGSLVGAYITVGHLAKAWPPGGVQLDQYAGNMMALTMLMSVVTVEWACYAIKRDDQAQSTWGLALTIGFGAGFLLLLWQVGRQVGFGPGSPKVGAFAVLFFALIGAAGALALIGLVALILALGRTLGHQMNGSRHEMIRATAWIWDFVVLAWIAVYATIWLFT